MFGFKKRQASPSPKDLKIIPREIKKERTDEPSFRDG